MQTLVVDHPLVAHKLTALRDVRTQSPAFRLLSDELVTLLAYEATRHIRVEQVQVQTPIGQADGVRLGRPVPLVVPVLRAGIGMLDGMVRLLPTAEVGFVGLARDDQTLVASTYAARLPADLTGREAFVLDPMLATGGTLETVISMLVSRGAAAVTAICLLAAPEGAARLAKAFPADVPVPVRVVTAGMDQGLNEIGYIVPGLGDAGDRLFGEIYHRCGHRAAGSRRQQAHWRATRCGTDNRRRGRPRRFAGRSRRHTPHQRPHRPCGTDRGTRHHRQRARR